MIPINDIFDFVIIAGVLTLAVLVAVARRRIFRSNERVKIRPSVALFSQIHRQIKIDYVGVQFITLAARGDNRKGAALRPNT
jgi:hypothetical protein